MKSEEKKKEISKKMKKFTGVHEVGERFHPSDFKEDKKGKYCPTCGHRPQPNL